MSNVQRYQAESTAELTSMIENNTDRTFSVNDTDSEQEYCEEAANDLHVSIERRYCAVAKTSTRCVLEGIVCDDSQQV